MIREAIPLRHLVRFVDTRAGVDRADELPLLSVSLSRGVIPRSELGDEFGRAEDLSNYKVCQPGDIVLNRMSAYQGALGLSHQVGLVSPDYSVIRPSGVVLPEYIAFVMKSDWFVAQMAMRIRGIGSVDSGQVRTPRINNSDLATIPIPLPPLEEQRRIANYLDDQTTRIDQAIQLRQLQLASLSERRAVAVDAILQELGVEFPAEMTALRVIVPAGWVVLPLGRVVAQFTNGYVGPTRDILVEDGIPYVQSVHIKNGCIDFDRRPFHVTRQWFEARPRIHLQPGDVLIVQTGDIGQVAVVPPGFGDAACHALQIARASRRWLSGPYLGAYLSSQFARSHMLSRATGALHPHLEAGVKSVPIVVPPKEMQSEILKTLDALRDVVGKAEAAVRESIRLLHERRRTLISSATAGSSHQA